jgi:hypothetical protein
LNGPPAGPPLAAPPAAALPTLLRFRDVLVALVAAVAYLPSLRNLYTWDDVLVYAVRRDLSTASLGTLFDGGYFLRYREDTYRPVVTLTYMLDHRLGGSPILAGHLQGLIWHALAAVATAALAARVLARRTELGALLPPTLGPLVAGIFFAVHPAATEAALSIGFREDVIATVFAAASVLLALRGGRWLVAALAAYVLAFFAKENAIVVPGLLLVGRLALPTLRLPRRALALELAAFGLVSAACLVVRFGIMPGPSGYADPVGGSYAATIVAVPRIFAHYLRLLVVPWPLLVHYAGMFPLGAPFVTQLPWLVLDLIFLGCVGWLLRARSPVGFGLAWFVVALLPMLNLIPLRFVAADRFTYLPLVGGALAMGALTDLAERSPLRGRAGARAALGAALITLVALTERRIPVWHDDISLWRETVKQNPHAYAGHFVLATGLAAAGDGPHALREHELALAECPRETRFGRERVCAYYASVLGFQLTELGDLPGARRAFLTSLDMQASFLPGNVGLGLIALRGGDLAGARRYEVLARAADFGVSELQPLLLGLRTEIDRVARGDLSRWTGWASY